LVSLFSVGFVVFPVVFYSAFIPEYFQESTSGGGFRLKKTASSVSSFAFFKFCGFFLVCAFSLLSDARLDIAPFLAPCPCLSLFFPPEAQLIRDVHYFPTFML